MASELKLSDREIAALAVLARMVGPISGRSLAARMCEAGRPTSPAAAHQAGAALARKGLAVKDNWPLPDSSMKYEATNAGQAWIARYQAAGGSG